MQYYHFWPKWGQKSIFVKKQRHIRISHPQISLGGNFQVVSSILKFQPFLAILAFSNSQKWLKNQNFEKMKNTTPYICLDYRKTPKFKQSDQWCSLGRDPKFADKSDRHTYIQTNMHTYKHTYIHTYIHTF